MPEILNCLKTRVFTGARREVRGRSEEEKKLIKEREGGGARGGEVKRMRNQMKSDSRSRKPETMAF